MIINLGMSKNFGYIDFEHLTFPNHMRVDYIRVYQPPHAINIGCDPSNFPTEAYISRFVHRIVPETVLRNLYPFHSIRHIEAYTNPNLTMWVADYDHPFPKNSFLGSC